MNVMRFRVYTDANPEGQDFTVLPADRMRAERHSTQALPPSQRGPGAVKAHPESWVLLWLWCAATRLGLTADGFDPWADTLLDYERLDKDGNVARKGQPDDELEAEAVDPTLTAASTS